VTEVRTVPINPAGDAQIVVAPSWMVSVAEPAEQYALAAKRCARVAATPVTVTVTAVFAPPVVEELERFVP